MTTPAFIIGLILAGITVGVSWWRIPEWFPGLWEMLETRGRVVSAILVTGGCLWLGEPIVNVFDAAVSNRSRYEITGFLAQVQADEINLGESYEQGDSKHVGTIRIDTMPHFCEDAKLGVYGKTFGLHKESIGLAISDMERLSFVRDKNGHIQVKEID